MVRCCAIKSKADHVFLRFDQTRVENITAPIKTALTNTMISNPFMPHLLFLFTACSKRILHGYLYLLSSHLCLPVNYVNGLMLPVRKGIVGGIWLSNCGNAAILPVPPGAFN